MESRFAIGDTVVVSVDYPYAFTSEQKRFIKKKFGDFARGKIIEENGDWRYVLIDFGSGFQGHDGSGMWYVVYKSMRPYRIGPGCDL